MRIPTICLALWGACVIATAPLAASDAQRKPRPPQRPPAPPPITANPTPVPAAAAPQTPARPRAAAPRATARPASTMRGLVAVSGIFQPGTHDFTEMREFSYFREPATTTSDYAVERGGGFDMVAFVRVWRRLGVGAGVSSIARTSDANISARYPHPFFFSQARTASTTVGDLGRAEAGVHLSAAWLLPSTGRFGGVLYAGPTFFRITQDVVETLSVTETYPYDTVTIATGGSPAELSERAVGFHVGADVAWYFSKRVGLGALARYAAATTSVAIGTGNTFDLEAGGFQAGLGLRVRF
jgi:hypothetical protein